MQFEIRNRPDYACVTVTLANGEQVMTETGAMMGMSVGLKMETNMPGGLLGAAKRMIGGESVFLNTYTATADGQRLDAAPSMPGDITHVRLENQSLAIQRGSFCVCTPGITLDAKWGGLKGLAAGEGLTMLRASGTGDLFLSSYGAIHFVDVKGSYIVDTTNIVAFDESLTFRVRPLGGVKSLLFSKEGLVCEFSGTGRLWLQTRSVDSLAAYLHPFRRVRPKSNN
jgi:uncharacterized protein (TIGR00266 family)